MSSLDITCSNLTDLVTEYLESALDADQQLSFETHLVFCAECQVFLGQMRDTVALLRDFPRERIDDKERAVLLAAYGDRR